MGGRITESTIREIREKTDIVTIVSESVSLSRSGASFRGLCPFHREKTPSFFVHPARQAFKCFGCGEGGSVFHFLMKARNLSFAEAVEELGERAGVPIRYEGGGARPRPGEDLYRVLKIASEAYRDLLRASPAGKAARDFLARRGVTREAEQEFFLGYGGGGKDLLSVLARNGVEPECAARAGLLFAEEGGGFRERFRGRVIFPIADARGRVCGFGARAMGDANPKYLNSPESGLYRKSSLLYGLFQALPFIRNEKRVVVVEGYMDLIGLWQRGLRNVVATCGTSLTENHARTLKRLSDTVVLMYDGDLAGKKSSVRAGEPLYSAGVSPLVLFPPKGMDPDDWAKETPAEELRDRIAKAAPLMEYIERSAARKFDLAQIQGKMSYLRLMRKYLPWVVDPAERRMYVQTVARAAGIPEETVLDLPREGGGAPGREIARTPGRGPGGAPEEDMLLRLLSADPSLIVDIQRDGVPEILEGGEVREVIARLAEGAGKDEGTDVGAVLDGEISEGARSRLAAEMFLGEISAEDARRIYPDVVLGLKIRMLDREIARAGEAYKAAVAAGEERRARETLDSQIAAKREKERLELARKNANTR